MKEFRLLPGAALQKRPRGFHSEFASRLRMLRFRSGLTQRELGVRIGVGRATIGRWSDGSTQPRVGRLIRLCDFFGVSCDSLIGLKEFEEGKDRQSLRRVCTRAAEARKARRARR